ncbi:MAG: preprotein translocase subunit SecA [Candidatus Omnitrophica bacterium CG1_02_49_10]|nr:MAG: preprotein translocase subunit SecA [Candidatus Omnitrophica bacterium CG1_02_49_10]
MINFILKKILGDQSKRWLKKAQPAIDKINTLEERMKALPDDALRSKTDEFRKRIAGGESPDALLPEAFAAVREAGRRVLNMRHFDVQLAGGIALHEGKIAEMATGEGKTLVATLPVYLNALKGEGVHVVTVNDYLARRDRDWMGPLYEFLGLSVGAIQHDMDPETRKASYNCDVTYGTNNEFGFDYLRDNMVMNKGHMVQRPLNYAIVDEVDSILVDEARTPLIISGPTEESTDKYYKTNRAAGALKGRKITTKDEVDAKYKGEDLFKGYDYIADEKAHTIALSEEGESRAAGLLGIENLHDINTMDFRHHVIAALRAKEFYRRDVDYVVKDGQVVIVDEFTGRLMPGRRWSDGLHQAVEAREGLKIERENQTLATISFQNYFRMYKKLSGMTGTAETEAAEFKHIYKLDVVVIPTNRPLIRTNHPDAVYKSEKEKYNAVVDTIAELYAKKRPVLVGTISIEKSERLGDILRRRGIPHNVLNAKYHEMEAHIVAQAGRFGAVTIATNMAGRGTDILLGGNPEAMTDDIVRQKSERGGAITKEERKDILAENRKRCKEEHDRVVSLGGLHIIGTERHEARRIDNQLRGRSGRQGDPGSNGFYISLGDDLMRLFGSERIAGMMEKLGIEEGQVIQHPLVSRSIETAQKRVEAHNFEIRKHLLEYDDVMNTQRQVIYDERRAVLEGEDLKGVILQIFEDILAKAIQAYMAGEERGIDGFREHMMLKFGVAFGAEEIMKSSDEELSPLCLGRMREVYERKESEIGKERFAHIQKIVMLNTIDAKWKEHLYNMDYLREGIGLRAYGQRDPLTEYKHEGYEMFQNMIDKIREDIAEFVFKFQVSERAAGPVPADGGRGVFNAIPQQFLHKSLSGFSGLAGRRPPPMPSIDSISDGEREEAPATPYPSNFCIKVCPVFQGSPEGARHLCRR